MKKKRTVEIFSAGCPICIDVIKRVYEIAGSSCAIYILDVHDPVVAAWAAALGIRRVPAVVVDGERLDFCTNDELDEEFLELMAIEELNQC